MRPLLAAGGLVSAVGVFLLVWGVREEVAWTDCRVRCVAPDAWPVTLGIVLLVAGGAVAAWAAAADYAGRVLHPAPGELAERDRLRRVGVVGTARVLEAREAGTSPVGDPLMDVQLAVEVTGRPPYEVRQRTAVPRRRLRRLQPGRPVPVLVDPADPNRLIVDWTPRFRRAQAPPAAEADTRDEE